MTASDTQLATAVASCDISAMVPLRRIVINNNTGTTQSYALFAAEPTIDPPLESSARLENHIILTFRGVSGNGGQAFISMPYEELHAVCGTRSHELASDGVQVEVIDRKPIRLGYLCDNGQVVSGTTCDVTAAQGALSFDADQALPSLGDSGAFCIRTKPDFSYKEARVEHFILGYGFAISNHSTADIGPFCVFCPSPNTLYNIKPGSTFFIAAGNYEPRTPTPPGLESQGNCCKIDFDLLKSNAVALEHMKTGVLTLQKPPMLRV